MSKELAGKTILVTRSREQASPLVSLLEQEGATVLVQPVIEIKPPVDWSLCDHLLSDLSVCDWLVFSSQNGVHYFFERFLQKYGPTFDCGNHLRDFGIRIAAMGPATAAAVGQYNAFVDCVPEKYCAEGMIAALTAEARQRKRFVLVRGDRGRQILSEELIRLGGTVSQVSVYRSIDIMQPDENVYRLMQTGKIDAVTVTSSAIANSLLNLFGDMLAFTKIISISPLTSAVLTITGLPIDQEATTASIDSLVAAAKKAFEE
ncbi:MAG: uroporphyrinogen-III synthase [Planctomycetia bacterium]|nr:uroporphyrinogen-III synthase [Planctomycetia bacterium]